MYIPPNVFLRRAIKLSANAFALRECSWSRIPVSALIALSSALIFAAMPRAEAAAGATTSFKIYEAESGTLGGGATVRTATAPATDQYSTPELEASGRSFVELNANGESVTITNNTASSWNGINLRYSIPDSAGGGGINSTINLYVNGTLRQAIPVTSVQTWLYDGTSADGFDQNPATGHPHVFFDEVHVQIQGAAVAPGSTIKLQKDAANSATFYDVDLVDMEALPAQIAQPANSLSIVTYGAVANNSSIDSMPAIQSCINAAVSMGKSVWVPAGTYYLINNNGLKITSPVTLQGAGMWYSKLYHVVPIPAPGVSGSVFDALSSTIKDICLDANSIAPGTAGGAGGGINQYGSNWMIDSVWFQHVGTGVWASGTNGTVQNCRIANTWGDGINLNNLHDSVGTNLVAKNNVIRGTGDDGMALNSVHNNGATIYTIMESCSFINNTITAAWWANCLRVAGGRNVLVRDNLIGGSAKSTGMNVAVFGTNGDGLESGVVEGNVINSGSNSFSAHKGSMHIGHNTGERVVDKVHIRNNTINGSFYDGITFAQATNIWLQNNTIASPKLDGIAAPSTAIGAAVLDGNTVTGLLAGHVASSDSSSSFAYFPKILATAYTGASSGVTTGTAGGGDSGTDLQTLNNGYYVWYGSVSLTGMTKFIARAATASAGGNIEIRLGSPAGTLIGTCPVTSTGDYHGWKDFYTNLTASSGTFTVYLVFTGSGGGLMNLESFSFTN